MRLLSVGTDRYGDSPISAALNTSQQQATAGCWSRSRIDHISLAARNESAFSMTRVTSRAAA